MRHPNRHRSPRAPRALVATLALLATSVAGCSLLLDPAQYRPRDAGDVTAVDGALDAARDVALDTGADTDAADVTGDAPVDACVATGQEVCDGVDNDCNGMIDDGLGTIHCGTGTCARDVPVCDNGRHIPCVPGAPTEEICDGLDNNCNGTADDGIGTQTCGVGVCMHTIERCQMGAEQLCMPGVPGREVCNGLDDNCDGHADEGGVCTVDAGVPCMPPGVLCGMQCVNLQADVLHCGTCSRVCSAGQACVMGTCVTPCTPTTEVCDGVDNDCNGVVDDNLGSSSCGAGICARTVLNCVGGRPQMCAPGAEMPEVCNGVDDNCNGMVDDAPTDVGGTCSTGMAGVCGAGVRTCVSGVPRCVPGRLPGPEVCNGVDDDCNGTVDDGVTGLGVVCSTGLLGVCATGSPQCQMGHVTCLQLRMPAPEVCNGADDNCDGRTDENGVCVADAGETCVPPSIRCDGNCVNTNTDANNCGACGAHCATGQACMDGVCRAVCVPTAEVCNGIDDNCDGQVDNIPNLGTACTTMRPGRCSMGHLECQPMGSTATTCVPNQGPVPEVCNGVDDDCNGTVDDVLGLGTRCSTGLLGTCGTGVQVCGAVGLICQQLNVAGADVCNGLDDNCDGTVDNCALGHTCVAVTPGGPTGCCRRAGDTLGCLSCTLVERCVTPTTGTTGTLCCLP